MEGCIKRQLGEIPEPISATRHLPGELTSGRSSMLLTSWVRSFRETLFSRRRRTRRRGDVRGNQLWQPGRRLNRTSERLEERTLLTALVVDQDFVDIRGGSVTLGNSDIDVDNDGTPEFDEIVFDNVRLSGFGAGINVNLSGRVDASGTITPLELSRIAFQDVTIVGAGGGGLNVTLNNVNFGDGPDDPERPNGLILQNSQIGVAATSSTGGPVVFNLTDVQVPELTVFQTDIFGGSNAGLRISLDSQTRNTVIGEIDIAESNIDGVSLTSTGIEQPVFQIDNTNPLNVTVASHGFQTGSEVTIEDVQGATVANTTATITVPLDPQGRPDQNQFTLDGIDGTGTGTYVNGTGTVFLRTTINSTRFRDNTITGTTGADGVEINLTNTNAPELNIEDHLDVNDPTQLIRSISVNLDNSPLDGFTIRNNRIDATRPSIDGLRIAAVDSTLSNLLIDNNTVAGNLGMTPNPAGAEGIVFDITDGNVSGIFTRNIVQDTLGDGLEITATVSQEFVDENRGPLLFDFQSGLNEFDGNTFSGNQGAGVFVDLPENVAINATLTDNTFTSNGVRGLDFTVAKTAAQFTQLARGGVGRTDTTLRVIDASAFTQFTAPFNVMIEAEELTVTGTVLNEPTILTVIRGVNGTRARFHPTNADVIATQGDAFRLTLGGDDVTTDRNVFDGNTGGGLRLTLVDRAAGAFVIQNNVIINSQGNDADDSDGISVNLVSLDANVPATNILRRSVIDSNLIGIDSFTTLPFAITDTLTTFTLADESVFNLGAGLQVNDVLRVDGEQIRVAAPPVGNTITVERNFNGTTAAPHAANAILTPTTGGNNDRGIDYFFEEQSVIEDVQIVNNIVANNTDDGVRFIREDDGITRTVNASDDQRRSVTIANNVISGNAIEPEVDIVVSPNLVDGSGSGSGLEIIVRNGTTDEFDVDIRDNTIANQVGPVGAGLLASSGLRLHTEADARIETIVTNNIVAFNGLDGFKMTERFSSVSDRRDIAGQLFGNDFSNNVDDGIDIGVPSGENVVFIVGADGVDSQNRSLGNTVSFNGDSGIDITGTAGATGAGGGTSGSRISITNNELDFNGQVLSTAVGVATPTGQSARLGSGIKIQVGSSQISVKDNRIRNNNGAGIDINLGGDISIRDNIITFNQNDGVEIQGSTEATILGNLIGSNVGRGIDILVAGGSNTNAKIGNGLEAGRNNIISNRREGIYIITSVTDQDQNVDSGVPLDATAASFSPSRVPNLLIQVDTNSIEDNGSLGGLPATGIRARIGSSNGGRGSEALAAAFGNSSSVAAGTVTDAGANGRTNARIINNDFDGNFGDDARFEAFISTAEPQVTQGDWTLTNTPPYDIDPNQYLSDPLARLNLVFEGNVGNGLRALGGSAAYQIAEPVFKSRDSLANATPGSSDEVPPAGPFINGGTRPGNLPRSIINLPARAPGGVQFAPLTGPNLPPPMTDILTVTNVQDVALGNGVTELQVTVGGAITFPNGAFVEISGVSAIGGGLHTANGVQQVFNVNVGAGTFQLRNTAGHGGPQFSNGGTVVWNNPANQSFLYPGISPSSTFRIAQGFDTQGPTAADEFSGGSGNFSDGAYDIWTPNETRSGSIINVESRFDDATIPFGQLRVTTANHGLSPNRQITITGVQGIPAANGFESLAVGSILSVDQFLVTGSAATAGAFTGGGTFVTIDDSFTDPLTPTFPTGDVVDITPDPRSTNTGVVALNFSEPVTGLDVDDLLLLRDGRAVDVGNVLLQQVNARQFTVNLGPATALDGDYELIIDGRLPEATIVPVTPNAQSGPVDNIVVNFSEDVTGVDIFDFTLSRDLGDGRGPIAVDLSEIGANLEVRQITPSTYSIDLSTVTDIEAQYRLTLLAPRTAALISQLTPNSVTILAATNQVNFNVVGHGLSTGQTVTVQGVTANGGATPVNGVFRILVVDGDNFRLATDRTLITPVSSAVGSYTFGGSSVQFDPGIIDRVGRPFSVVNVIRTSGLSILADASDTWVRASAAPTVDLLDVTPDPRNSPVPSVTFRFSEPVLKATVDTSDFQLSRDTGFGPVAVLIDPNIAIVTPLDDPLTAIDESQAAVLTSTLFRLDGLTSLTTIPGDYRLTLITTGPSRIQDAQGLSLSFPATDDFTVVTTGPAPEIIDVFPDPRPSAASAVTFVFSEGVEQTDGTSLDNEPASDFFTLTRDAGDGNGPQDVPLTGIMLTQSSSTVFEIDLRTVTSSTPTAALPLPSIDGNYTLTLNRGSAIRAVGDLEQLAVDGVDTWVQDSTNPTAEILSIDPDPRVQSPGVVTVQFAEPVRGVDRFDAATDFTLTLDIGDGNGPLPIPLTDSMGVIPVRPISPVDANGNPVRPFVTGINVFASAYILDLSDIESTILSAFPTVDGNYELTLTDAGGIADDTGNAYLVTGTSVDAWERLFRTNNDPIIDAVFPAGGPTPSNNFVTNRIEVSANDEWFTDTIPPAVVSGTVSIDPDPRSTPVGIVTINFSEPVLGVDITDFDLTLNGNAVSLNGVTLTQIASDRYEIDLNLVTGAPGTYVFSIDGNGSLIRDTALNFLPQTLQLLDTWTVETIAPTATITAPTPRTDPADDIQVTFSKDVVVSAVDISDFRLERDTGSGFLVVSSAAGTVTANSPVSGLDDSFTLDLSAAGLTDTAGTYRVTLIASDSEIVDGAGIELPADATATWVLDNTVPTADVVDIFPDPRDDEVGLVNILFNEDVSNVTPGNAATGPADTHLVLLRDGGAVDISSLSISRETARRYTVDLASVTAMDGDYELRLSSETNITDTAGNDLLADTSLPVTGLSARDLWTIGDDLTAPTATFVAVTPDPRQTAVDTITVNFDEDVSGVDVSDFSLTVDGNTLGLVAAGVEVNAAPGSASEYQISGLSSLTAATGTYVLTLTAAGSGIIDSSTNANAIVTDAIEQWVTIPANLQATLTIAPEPGFATVPDPRLRAVNQIVVDFASASGTPVAVSNVGIEDFRLTRIATPNTDPIPVSLRQITVVQSPLGAQQYFIDLSTVSGTDGTYTLTLQALDSDITDGSSDLLSNASVTWVTRTTITVDTPVTADAADATPGDQIPEDAAGNTTLRAAINEANALPGDDIISLPAGTFAISLGGIGEQGGLTGDFDITDVNGSLTIRGAGAEFTIINGASVERVFHVLAGASLILEDVTISGGRVIGSDDGGGIRNDGGTVVIRRSVIRDNVSLDDGGAINNDGVMLIEDTTIVNNQAINNGGAIRNVGSLQIVNSMIGGLDDPSTGFDERNRAGQTGGALVNLGAGVVQVTGSTFSGNVADSFDGGAIRNASLSTGPGVVSLLNTNLSATDATMEVTDISAFGPLEVFDIRIGLEQLRVTRVDGDTLTVQRGINGTTAVAHVPGDTVTLISSLGLVNVTIARNESGNQGGGISAAIGRAILKNTLVISNVSGGGVDSDVTAPSFAPANIGSAGNNLIGTNSGATTAFPAGTANANGDFVGSTAALIDVTDILETDVVTGELVLADNGGPTLTHALISPGAGLIAQNFAINGGGVQNATVDQRGIARTLGNGTVDIGAYEFGGYFLNSTEDSIDVIPGDGFVADSLGRRTLRAAIMEVNALAQSGDSISNAIRLVGPTPYTLTQAEIDRTSPTADIIDVTPDPLAAAAFMQNPIDEITVTFTEPVQGLDLLNAETNFDLLFAADGTTMAAPISLAGVTLRQDSPTQYTLQNLETPLAADGRYELRLVSTGVTDFALQPNGLADDPAVGIAGVAASDVFIRGADVFGPVATVSQIATPRIDNPGAVTVTFDEAIEGIDTSNDPENFSLTFDDGVAGPVVIDLSGIALQLVSSTEFTLNLAAVLDPTVTMGLTAAGTYVLTFDPSSAALTQPIQDTLGNVSNQTPITRTWVVGPDMDAPTGTIAEITPDPRNSPVGVVTIDFSEDVTGVNTAMMGAETDFDLFYDVDGFGGGLNSVQIDLSTLTVIQVTDSQYTIDLSSVAVADGAYRLVLTTLGNVEDAAGNSLAADELQSGFVNSVFVGPSILSAGQGYIEEWVIGDDVTVTDSLIGTLPAPPTNTPFTYNPTAFGDLDILGGSLIISGDGIAASTIDGNSIDRVFDVRFGATVSLTDLTVTGGVVAGGPDALLVGGGQIEGSKDGGGIRSSGSLLLTRTEIAGNSADGRGGGVFVDSVARSTPLVTTADSLATAVTAGATTITLNSAMNFPTNVPFEIQVTSAGGVEQMQVTAVAGNVFTVTRGFNGTIAVAHTANAVVALALPPSATTLTVTDASAFPMIAGFQIQLGAERMQVTTVAGNTFTVRRGVSGTTAINHFGGETVSLVQNEMSLVSIRNNQADFGGGLFNDDSGSVTIVESTFTSNAATTDGGGLFNDRTGTVAITGTQVTSNSAGRDGGGLYNNDQSTLTAIDSTISQNTAVGDGGGLLSELAALATLNNTTVAANSAERGGGVFNQDGTVTITASPLSANTASGDGGGFYVTSNGVVNAGNSTLSGNTAEGNGGGFRNEGVVTLSNTRVIDNTSNLDGGGVSNTRVLTLQNGTTVTGNVSGANGGGIASTGNGNVNLAQIVVTSNTAAADGGAIHNSGGSSLTVTSSTLSSSSAGDQGGGLYHSSTGQTTVASSTLSNNTAREGGGLYTSRNLTLQNSTLSTNTATTSGGGVANNGGTITFQNGTVFNNTAAVDGGGIDNQSAFGQFRARNTIVAGNTAPADADVTGVQFVNQGNNLIGDLGNSVTGFSDAVAGVVGGVIGSVTGATNASPIVITSASHGLSTGDRIRVRNVTGNTAANGVFDVTVIDGNTLSLDGTSGNGTFTGGGELIRLVDSLLGPLQDNGGPTLTHALLFGSPARDRGSNVGALLTDQRGFGRIFDGDGDGVATVDIGAFESGFVVNTFVDSQDVSVLINNIGDQASADANGSSSLRAAVMEANAQTGDDTLLLIPGTYQFVIAGRNEDGAARGDLDILGNLTIIGSGVDETIIDAAGLDRVFHVLAGAQLNLKNLTVRGGSEVRGGGILNQGVLTLENVVVEDNSADFGGGIYNDLREDSLANTPLTATDLTLTVGSGSQFPSTGGFDIRIDDEELRVTTVNNQTYTVTRGVNGTTAAPHNVNARIELVQSMTVVDSTIRSNEARLQGGGLLNLNELTITRSVITTNSSNAQGGGLFNEAAIASASTEIIDTTFNANYAHGAGGGIYNSTSSFGTSTIDIRSTTLSRNEAGAKGGAIYNNDRLDILNSTISTNVAQATAAGIYNVGTGTSNGAVTITNSTFLDNAVDGTGGGIVNVSGSNTVTLRNTIVASNTAPRGNNDLDGSFISSGANFIGDAGNSGGFVNGVNLDAVGTTGSPFDPVVGPLQDNGGPTQTHALLAGSPALDAGDNSGGEPVDQRGGRRPTDSTADIGAFEVQENRLSINEVRMAEGTNGSTLFVFTVLLETATAEPVSVVFTTVQATAQAGSDFLSTSGTLNYAPGDLTQTIVVEVNGDTTPEDTEAFKVRLTNPVNAVLIGSTCPDDPNLECDQVDPDAPQSAIEARGIIDNDDAILTVDAVSTSLLEGAVGENPVMTVTVLLSNAVVDTAVVNFTTTDTGTATATEGIDYQDATGSVTFAPGDTVQTFDITLIGDNAAEPHETFNIELTSASPLTIGTSPQATGTILNDDVQLTIAGVSDTEGTGGLKDFGFGFSLAQQVAQEITFQVQTTGVTATSGADFFALNAATVTIPANLTNVPVPVTQNVQVVSDTTFEGGTGTFETFQLDFVAGSVMRGGMVDSNAILLGGPATGTIEDDEPRPIVWTIRRSADMLNFEVDRTDDSGSVTVFSQTVVTTMSLAVPNDTSQPLDSGMDDQFVVDFTNGNPIPTNGLTVNGFTQVAGDSLQLTNASGTFTNITYTATGTNSGTVVLDDGTVSTINYTGLEPVRDFLNAQNRTFTIDSISHPGDHPIRIANAPSGQTIIDSNGTGAFENITFNNPTTSLTVNAGDGTNAITVEPLEAGFTGTLTVNAGGGNDTVDANMVNFAVTLNGEAGNDVLTGSAFGDSITGGLGTDNIVAGAGNDFIQGGDDNDTIDGGAGADNASGDGGQDLITGGTENDTLDGGAGDDIITGDAGNDSITGGDNNDNLSGGDGADNIDGEGGNDTVSGDGGQDTVDGGGDADTVSGGADNDTVRGGAGDDVVTGDDGDDSLDGGDDNDTLDGGLGVDAIDGGNGGTNIDQLSGSVTGSQNATLTNTTFDVAGLIDTFLSIEQVIIIGGTGSNRLDASAYTIGSVTIDGGDGNDTLLGSAGSDSLNGGLGDDSIDAGAGNDIALGGGGRDTINGNDGNDTLGGNSGNDVLNGGAGFDSAAGGDGDDVLSGGDNNDTLEGDLGNDVLMGEAGNDRLIGDAGADLLIGGDGVDRAFGNAGNDTLRGGNGRDTLNGGAGRDDLNGEGDKDRLLGGAGRDVLATDGSGVDTLNGQGSGLDSVMFTGTSGDDVFLVENLGSRYRILDLSGSNDRVVVTRTERVFFDTMDGDDAILVENLATIAGVGVFNLTLGAGNDTVSAALNTNANFTFVVDAGTGNDTIDTGAGNDNISAGDGDDSVTTGSGDDTINGGSGADSLNGMAGADVIDGGTGSDTILGGSEADSLVGGAGDDTIRGNGGEDTIFGGDGRDLLFGDEAADDIFGEDDADSIAGGGGNDNILGGDGNDVIKGEDGEDFIEGGNGNDTISGGLKNDRINGQDGQDKLFGDADNDTLTGGGREDLVVGGRGADSISGQGTNRDTLVGETGLEGSDDDTPDPGDTFDNAAEINNAFVVPQAIFDLLDSFI